MLSRLLVGSPGSYSPGAAWEDTKLWGRNLTGWQKVAVVSDADWLDHAIKAFGWLMPGEIRVFDLDEVTAPGGG